MAKTVLEVLTLARRAINDPNSKRLDGNDGLRVYNDMLLRMFNERPDIFVGQLTASPTPATSMESVAPYEDKFANVHSDYIVEEVEASTDEDASAARANMHAQKARR